jgi:Pex19 protein family
LGGGTNQMVDFILQNLLSKEVLYGPLVEIRDKYPLWLQKQRMMMQQPLIASHISPSPSSEGLEKGPESVSLEDLARFEKQYESIQRVCTQVS